MVARLAMIAGLLGACGRIGYDAAGAGPDGGGADAAADGAVAGPECQAAADCAAAQGPAPCGAWECSASGRCDVVCPGCQDADLDGYGLDTVPGACAGPDCDDASDRVGAEAKRPCYGGPTGTQGVGACRAGVERCAAGTWSGLCGGQATPAGGEACNGEDDDCDGLVDEDLGTFACGLGACAVTVPACAGGVLGICVPGDASAVLDSTCDGVDDDCDGAVDEDCPSCAHVEPAGNDAMAVATGNLVPFRTIQAAIDWVAADVTRPKRACVAAAPACGGGGFAYGEDVRMRDGVSVYANYEHTTWTRCPGGLDGSMRTVLRPASAEGVRFDASVAAPTVLDGFVIERASQATTAAITVDGARGVVLSNLEILPGPMGPLVTIGIDLKSGAEALITRSAIDAGEGTTAAVAIRSRSSRPTIQGNCDYVSSTTGRCIVNCGARGIRGLGFGAMTATTAAVELESSPGARVETSSICGAVADRGVLLAVLGDATGLVVRGNFLLDFQGAADEAYGLHLEDCGGASPWIVDNEEISSSGQPFATVHAIHAAGDCHPVIDANVRISGAVAGSGSTAVGVFCGSAGGVASRCAVVGNTAIDGNSTDGSPATARGVECRDGGCLRVAGNVVLGGRGSEVAGIALARTGTLVERNLVTGGCGANAAGVFADDSFARLENNLVFAGSCAANSPSGGSVFAGLRVRAGAFGLGELDVHSNDLDGDGDAVGCAGAALRLETDAAAPPAGARGVYRNNIFRGGRCPVRLAVEETDGDADPRLFENNDLDPTSSSVLYRDEDLLDLTSIADVNQLAGAAGNISVDPLFTAYPTDLHLAAGSMCIGAGTAAGAPHFDMDGDARGPAAPDIGADERP